MRSNYPTDRSTPRNTNALYERRLLPVFQHVNSIAATQGKSALLTIPGLGCGCFAGGPSNAPRWRRWQNMVYQPVPTNSRTGSTRPRACAGYLTNYSGYPQHFDFQFFQRYVKKASYRIRTDDLLITNQLLYQLS